MTGDKVRKENIGYRALFCTVFFSEQCEWAAALVKQYYYAFNYHTGNCYQQNPVEGHAYSSV
jgi:hypothetical protein